MGIESFGNHAETKESKAEKILEEARKEGESLREYYESLPAGGISDENKAFYALEKEYNILNGALTEEMSPEDEVAIQQRMEEILAENPKFLEDARESAEAENTRRVRDERANN